MQSYITTMLFRSPKMLFETKNHCEKSTSTRSTTEVAALEQRLAEAHSEHERAEQRHGDVTVHLKAQLRDLQVGKWATESDGKVGKIVEAVFHDFGRITVRNMFFF